MTSHALSTHVSGFLLIMQSIRSGSDVSWNSGINSRDSLYSANSSWIAPMKAVCQEIREYLPTRFWFFPLILLFGTGCSGIGFIPSYCTQMWGALGFVINVIQGKREK